MLEVKRACPSAGTSVARSRTFGRPNVDSTDPGLDGPLRAETVSDNPSAAIRQALISKTGEEIITFRSQGFSQHAARTLACQIAQRIIEKSPTDACG